uniref:Uncharacterized protein n=1 Tax=Daucus carota subsp. sativus TaxID=79200 RepID=A0A166J3C6_DAUCS
MGASGKWVKTIIGLKKPEKDAQPTLCVALKLHLYIN